MEVSKYFDSFLIYINSTFHIHLTYLFIIQCIHTKKHIDFCKRICYEVFQRRTHTLAAQTFIILHSPRKQQLNDINYEN